MRRFGTGVAVVVVVTLTSGCAERASRPAESAPATAPKSEAKAEAAKPAPPPASSPLAKIKEGMGMKEVSDILGQPSDQSQYVTGKAFIPWYYGDDVTRIQWHYKGTGRVIFTGGGAWGQRGGQVQWVEYDPNESGYRR